MTESVLFRLACSRDLPVIVRLLADDPLGARRERVEEPLPDTYQSAFEAIHADPNNELVVATSGDDLVGVLQLTFIPSITYVGAWRAQIEGVRVAKTARGMGIGRVMLEWAIRRARQRGCKLIQLTTNIARPEALRFYEAVGFAASHHGMKLILGRHTTP